MVAEGQLFSINHTTSYMCAFIWVLRNFISPALTHSLYLVTFVAIMTALQEELLFIISSLTHLVSVCTPT